MPELCGKMQNVEKFGLKINKGHLLAIKNLPVNDFF